MIAVIGGVGLIGFLMYRHFSQPRPGAYVPVTTAPKPGFLELILGTTQTYLGNKITASNKAEFDKALAAWKASGKGSAANVAYLGSGESYGACYSKETGKTVSPDACIAAGLTPPPAKPAGLAGLGGYGGIFKKGMI